MRRIVYLSLAVLLALWLANPVLAMMCGTGGHGSHKGETVAQPAEEAVEVGNTLCPVSGEHIKEAEAIKIEHEGKIYNLCCKMCEKDFKKDPKKYIEKVEAQETKEAAGHAGHEGHAH